MKTTGGSLFSRYAKSLIIGRGDLATAASYAASQGWSQSGVIIEAIKAASNAITIADYAGALGPIGTDLAEYLRPRTLIGRIVGMRPAPFLTRLIDQSGGVSASFVADGESIHVAAAAFDAPVTLAPTKVSGIAVITGELARLSTPKAEDVLAADIGRAVALGMDLAFLDPDNAGSASSPASITHGAPAFTSSGSSIGAIDADLASLLTSLTNASVPLELAFWSMTSATASHLALLRGSGGAPAYPFVTAKGGSLLGLPVLTTNAAMQPGSPSDRTIVLADADSILIADDGEADITLSNTAALQLSTAPAAGAQPLISLWQNNLAAIKGTRFVTWLRRRPQAVAVLRGVQF